MKKSALDLMENIDERFITEANEKHRSRKPFIISAVAACACIAVVLSVTLKDKPVVPEIPVTPPETENTQISVEPIETPPVIDDTPEPAEKARTEPFAINPHPKTSLAGNPIIPPAIEGENARLSELFPDGIGSGVEDRFADTFEATQSGVYEGSLNAGETLPVYMTKYSGRDIAEGKVTVSDEDKQIISDAFDLLLEKAGLDRESGALVNNLAKPDIPSVSLTVGTTRISSSLKTYYVRMEAVDISDPDWLNNMLDTEPVIKALLEIYGITDPHIEIHTSYPFFFYDYENCKKEYDDIDRNYCDRKIYISQNADTMCKYLTNSALYTMTVLYFENLDENTADVSFFFDKPTGYVHVGDFKVLTYEEALKRFCEETGKTEEDLVGWDITYRNIESFDYIVPVYAFYSPLTEYEYDGRGGTIFACTTVRAVAE